MRNENHAPVDVEKMERTARSRRSAALDMRRELDVVNEDLRQALAEATASGLKSDHIARERLEQKQKALFALRSSLEATSARLESEADHLEEQARQS